MPNEIAVTSKSSPNFSGTVSSWGSRKRLIIDSAKPRRGSRRRCCHAAEDEIMQRMKTEKPIDGVLEDAQEDAAKPPIDAPIAYAPASRVRGGRPSQRPRPHPRGRRSRRGRALAQAHVDEQHPRSIASAMK